MVAVGWVCMLASTLGHRRTRPADRPAHRARRSPCSYSWPYAGRALRPPRPNASAVAALAVCALVLWPSVSAPANLIRGADAGWHSGWTRQLMGGATTPGGPYGGHPRRLPVALPRPRRLAGAGASRKRAGRVPGDPGAGGARPRRRHVAARDRARTGPHGGGMVGGARARRRRRGLDLAARAGRRPDAPIRPGHVPRRLHPPERDVDRPRQPRPPPPARGGAGAAARRALARGARGVGRVRPAGAPRRRGGRIRPGAGAGRGQPDPRLRGGDRDRHAILARCSSRSRPPGRSRRCGSCRSA